jgi:hypothetical protein
MTETKQFGDDVRFRRYERDGGEELVADFGPATDVFVDVLGDTVIVVEDNEQHELAVEGDARAFIRNGVLTIEVDR